MTVARWVTATDGVQLAVSVDGETDGPVLLCLHGYPDDHRVWDGVAAALSDRYLVVRYDVRGAGESAHPTESAAYRLAQLQADFTAVIDSVCPEQTVHLLAHDWGSVQAWHFATSEDLRPRIASLTSISGPDLDHARRWLRFNLRHRRTAGKALRQLRSSYYTVLFQVPRVPERVITGRFGRRAIERSARIGQPSFTTGRRERPADADLRAGLSLYRANMLTRNDAQPRTTDVPVQVIAPASDPFVGTPMQHEAPRPFASDLRTRTVIGGHWIIADRPDVIAELTSEFVDEVVGRPAHAEG
jgi:pimeloyl-ACP methyl ester carboxylesterase